MLVCLSCGSGFKTRAESWFLEISPPSAPLAAIILLRGVHCPWEDETVRERSGLPPSYTEVKRMKSLTLHTHCCPRASLRSCSSSSGFLILSQFRYLLMPFFCFNCCAKFSHLFV